ncbi:VOC family protein [Bacillus solitudinis]|uniref:VOC family protein n=1 Tax=Bacillus solitudinis TaxID=2014074 RepID=UPI000C234677|nr:ring-cleaving dioxygenase [Bacillus solitudinis]
MDIKEIKLLTNCLLEQKEFYTFKLGLTVVKETKKSFTVAVGLSKLTFSFSDNVEKPYYHFALGISKDKYKEAKDWFKQRVTFNKVNGKDEFFSKLWNSQSLYFYDPAGNIVGFIARPIRNSPSILHKKDFCNKDILNISEIGLPVYNVPEMKDFIIHSFNFESYREGNETFMPLGNEEGLFILSKIDRVWLGIK